MKEREKEERESNVEAKKKLSRKNCLKFMAGPENLKLGKF